MKPNFKILFRFSFFIALAALPVSKSYGQLTLGIGSSPYVQNFNGIAGGLPVGWTVKTGATNSFLGTAATFNQSAVVWNTSTGQFTNCASVSSPATSGDNNTTQNSNVNRALAVRQTGSVVVLYDPGASFLLQLSNTTGLSDFVLNFKLMELDPTVSTGRTTTWNVDYGLGASPTSFTNVTTSPATITTTLNSWGTSNVSVNFGSKLNNIGSNVWIRICSKSTSSGSGSRPFTAIDDFSLSYNNFSAGTILPSSFCQGVDFSVPYSVGGPFNLGNTFTAQLSDAFGNFINPLNIGSLSSILSGTINATIPSNIQTGSGYRIRVAGSNPALISGDNGVNLTITELPIVSISGCDQLFKNSSTLTANISSVGAITNYQWVLNGITNVGSNLSTYITSIAGSYTVIATGASGCSATSSAFVLKSNSTPLSGIYTIPDPTCAFNTLDSAIYFLNHNGVSGPVTFNILAGYTETAPLGGYAINMCGLTPSLQTNASKTVVIQKSGAGINPIITSWTGNSSNADAILKIIGADYLTIDGIDFRESASNISGLSVMEWGIALLKCDGNNGANYNVIKNCNITLQNSVGTSKGFYSANHGTNPLIAFTYSGPSSAAEVDSSRNGNNKILSNTILNAYTPIEFVGNPNISGSYSLNDSLNEIGKISQGNTITNFGGSNTAAYVIYLQYQKNIKIIQNTLSGGIGSTNGVTGINIFSGQDATVTNNTISLTSNSASAPTRGIYCQMVDGTVANPENITIEDNYIQNCAFNVVTSGVFAGITNLPGGISTININNNHILNNNISSNGLFNGIINSGSPSVLSVIGNFISGNVKSGTGTMSLISYGAAGNSTVNSNTIMNNSMSGGTISSTFHCITGAGSASTYTINNNNLYNNGITNMGPSAIATVIGINQTSSPSSETIVGNQVHKLFVNGTNSNGSIHLVQALNQSTSSSSTRTVTSNQIDSIYSATGVNANVSAITSGTGGTVFISKNKISNILPGGTNSAKGIIVSGGTTSHVYNNLIGIDVGASNLTTATSLAGIEVSGGSGATLFYNTIRLAGSGASSNFGTSGINISTNTPNIYLLNNIIDNLTVPGGGVISACATALRRVSSSLTSYNMGSNRNIFYSGIPSSSHPIYYNGSSVFATLADFKTHVTSAREADSKTENVNFQSTSNTSADFLKVSTSYPTFVESHGGTIPFLSVLDDFFGTTRNSTTPDIGAHEGNFIYAGITIQSVALTPLTGQCIAVSHSVQATILPSVQPMSLVLLYYFFNGIAGAGSPVSMINTFGNLWTGTIPAATPSNATVTWTVNADVIGGGDFVQFTGTVYKDNYLLTPWVTSNPLSVCTGIPITLSALEIPPVAPAASSYCTSDHTAPCVGDYISHVVLNLLNNNTGTICGGASNYRYFNGGGSQTTTLSVGTLYFLTLTFGPDNNQYFGAWIDYNHNGTYDTLEFLGASTNAGTNGTISISFNIPATAYNGLTHMRIIGGNDFPLLNSQACRASSSTFGESQDYDVTISGAVSSFPPTNFISYSWSSSGTIVGSTNPVNINAPLTPGNVTYTVTGTNISGCSISSQLIVNVTSPGDVVISAPDTIICSGNGITLSAASGFVASNYVWSGSGGLNTGLPENVNTPAVNILPNTNILTDFKYSVLVTQINTGCISVDTIHVLVHRAVIASAIELNPDECISGQNSIEVSAINGTPPYSGTGTFSIDGGTHLYTVTDAVGCQDTSSITTIGQLFFNLPDTMILCIGESTDISIYAYVQGGKPPFNFTGDTTNLSEANYTYSVHDSQGCTKFATTHISIIDCIIPTVPASDSGKVNDVISSELTQIYLHQDSILDTTSTHYFINQGSILIEVVVNVNYYDSVLALIQTPAYGMTNIFANGDVTLIITGFYPINNLLLLNNLPSVINTVRTYNPPINNSLAAGIAYSLGDSSINASGARKAFNVEGEGVKIGILSDSYNLRPGNHAQIDVNNGDLSGIGNPYNTNSVEVFADYPYGERTDEGRAMLQIVHDVAPKAKLAFRTGFVTPGDFADGIIELQQNGCNVIGDDVTFINEPFFKDGVVSQAVDFVKSQGVSYFSAAGNFGARSYESVFNPMNPPAGFSGKAHNFGGGDSMQSVSLTPGLYTIALQWDDSIYSLGQLPGALNDLDIFLLDNAGQRLFGFNRVNTGEDPVEILQFFVLGNVTANILITKRATDSNVRFKYIVFRGNLTINEHNAGTSTLVGQANAKGAMAVGAALYSNTPAFGVSPPTVASFSSAGGTTVENSIRTKPDFVGPNGVNTTVNFNSLNIDEDLFPNFFGTSCAVPHAAGAAALMIEAKKKYYNGILNPDSVRNLFRTTAIDMGTNGFDYSSGFGLIQVDSALQKFVSPKPIITQLITNPLIIPGTLPFIVTIKGKYFKSTSKFYLRGVQISATVLNSTTITATVPVFSGNPPVQIYNPPISTRGTDGGFSEPKYFLPTTRKVISITADNKSKKFGDKIPSLSATILVDGVPYQNTIYSLVNLGLNNLQITTPVISTSDIGLYLIRASVDPLDPLDPADLALLEQFDYIFNDGLFVVNKMPISINPRDTTLSYGDKISQIHFNYIYDDQNIDIAERSNFNNSIRAIHNSTLDTAVAFIDDQVIVGGRIVINSDLDGIGFLSSGRSIANGRIVINRSLANSLDYDTTIVVDVSPKSIFNYQLDSANATLIDGSAVVNGRIVINGGAVVNGRIVINGTAVANSLNINDSTNSNVVIIVDSADVSAPVFDTITLRSINLITGFEEGTHIIVPGAFLSENFDITYGLGTLTIIPSELIATAVDTSRYVGDSDPAFTVSYSGFKYSDSPSTITESIAIPTSTQATPPGAYSISSIGGFSNNYFFTNIDGVLTIKARLILNLKMFIEGYYRGNGLMDNNGAGGILFVTGNSPNPTDVDSIKVSMMDPVTKTEVENQSGILQTNGQLIVTFGGLIKAGQLYYIVISHRNSISTWSALPVMINAVTTFDFTH